MAHHTRKPPNAANRESFAGDMDAARGAGSLGGVTRMGATLYTVDAAAAKRYGISEADARKYVRFDDGKANLSLISGEPHFFKREGVTIGGFDGEEIGVLRPVTLGRVKTPTETKADDNASIREAVRAMLRVAEGHQLQVLEIVRTLIENGTIEMISEEALRKRISTMFGVPLRYENGDVLEQRTRSVKGKTGRPAFITARFAENSK